MGQHTVVKFKDLLRKVR